MESERKREKERRERMTERDGKTERRETKRERQICIMYEFIYVSGASSIYEYIHLQLDA